MWKQVHKQINNVGTDVLNQIEKIKSKEDIINQRYSVQIADQSQKQCELTHVKVRRSPFLACAIFDPRNPAEKQRQKWQVLKIKWKK